MIEDKPLTRRRLIAFGGAAAATAMLPDLAFGGTRSLTPTRTSWLERGAYNGRVGEAFGMSDDGGGTVALKLVAVLDIRGKTSRGRGLEGRNDAFLLDFEVVSGSPGLGQLTRTFSHASLGRHDLFMVPSQPPDGPLRYSVLVNRSE